MLGFPRSKNAGKVPHRGTGALFAASSVLATVNANAAYESVGNTTLDTVRYAASALLLGGTAVVSFLKLGRNFEATMPLSQEISAAKAPKRTHSGRGAGSLFVASSIVAAANGAAIETLSNVNADTLRNGATALVLGVVAATSLVKRLRKPTYEFAYVGEPVAEFPSIAAESAPERFSPVIKEGAVALTIPELIKQADEREARRLAESLQAAVNGISRPISQ